MTQKGTHQSFNTEWGMKGMTLVKGFCCSKQLAVEQQFKEANQPKYFTLRGVLLIPDLQLANSQGGTPA
jgi:hypothetical protein